MPGTLYVVATPLGNLQDLSPRARTVLGSVPVVAAEDTRRTRGLLAHLGASPSLLSYHAHSDDRRAHALIDLLLQGRDVALVTDAGTPGVSDPGCDLVAAARASQIRVVPVPGPSAVATLLSAAGMPSDRYLFLGFIPRKGADRARFLSRASTEQWSVVFFEAPGRLVALLRDLAESAGASRRAAVGRELTKMHEEIRDGTLADLADYYSESSPRGEITLVMAGTGEALPPPDRTEEAIDRATAMLAEGVSRREVARHLTESLDIPRNDAYRLVMELP